jgi:DNA-binding SARP family transcriptional activator
VHAYHRRTVLEAAVNRLRVPIAAADASRAAPIFVCVLGAFQVQTAGQQTLALRGGGKAEALLTVLALHASEGVRRERLIDLLWPDAEPQLASQSLNSLVYSLHRALGPELGGVPPIVQSAGRYRLNLESGIDVDLARFDQLASLGDSLGDEAEAVEHYAAAARLYRGDLQVETDVHGVIERERVRARYLGILSRLADLAFASANYAACLEYVLRLLAADPCREDAHRLAMRCYVRRGERAQALRQFRVCESVLSAEFNAPPEPATLALFERVRLTPAEV